jgi:hypothetical protein
MDDRLYTDPASPELLRHVYASPDGAWRTSGGFQQVADAFAQTGAVYSLAWFTQHQGGRQWLCLEHEVAGALRLSYVDFSSDSLVTIQSGRTLVRGPWAGTSYVEHGSWLYVLNGYDGPVRWNGKERVNVGFSQIPSPPSVAVAEEDQTVASYSPAPKDFQGSSQLGIGENGDAAAGAAPFRVGYRRTWVNDLGQESPPSGFAWIAGENEEPTALLVAGRKSAILHCSSAPSNVRGQRLWRTVNVAGDGFLGLEELPVYLVAEVGTGGAFDYVDGKKDGDLGPLLDVDSLGLWPSRARFASFFKGCLFVDDEVGVRYSHPLFPEQMPSQNQIPLGDVTGGPTMGFKATKNALVVFKRRGIYLIKGDPVNGFYSETLTEDKGCAASRSITEIPGLGTMFVDDDGPNVLLGALENTGSTTEWRFLGEGIGNVWRRKVNKKALASCRAALNTRDRELWLQVPTGGDDRPKLGLIYHYDTGGWSTRPEFPFSCLAESRDHRRLLFGGSWDTGANTRGVLVYTRGHDLDGTAVTSEVRSAWLDTGTRAVPKSVVVHALNLGRPFSFQWHADRDAETWLGGADTSPTWTDSERNDPVWGMARWDVDVWAPRVPVRRRVDPTKKAAHEFQYRLTSTKLGLARADVLVDGPTDFVKRGAE